MNEYMDVAYKEALRAYKKDEVPVGAVIVHNGRIIAKAHNTRQKNKSVIDHAEIKTILKAEKKLKDWRLNDCDLYVTLKPCSMCEAIIKESRIKNVFFGLAKPTNKKEYNKLNLKQTNVRDEYMKILSDFFKNKR